MNGGNKMEALKKGQAPAEYKEWLGPKQKKYTAMSTFLNDRSLYDEYQNRFRAAEEEPYKPIKKANHQKMRQEVEEREERFLKVLQHDDQKAKPKPSGRKRPITSTAPTKIKNRQVVDQAQESDEDTQQVFRTFEEYEEKDRKFNKDLEVSDSQDNQQELDDVIDLMNNHRQQPNKEKQQKVERDEQEYDYLDYESNLENLKKINEEQVKFDTLGKDFES